MFLQSRPKPSQFGSMLVGSLSLVLELLQKVARTFARVLKFGRLAGCSFATLADLLELRNLSDWHSLQPFLAVLELWRAELQFCSPAKSVLQCWNSCWNFLLACSFGRPGALQCLTSLAAALVSNCCKCVAVLEVLQCCSFGRQSCSFAVLAMHLEPSLAACLGSVLEVSVWCWNSCSRWQEPLPGCATLPCSCGMLLLIGKFATLQCWSFGICFDNRPVVELLFEQPSGL